MKQMKERNNSGFTLVELLIAITILGIIVGPFMHSFVTAAKTNAKAQQIQNATLLATNIMEEVKANSMGDLAFQFNYPKRKDTSSRFDVMNTFSSAYELTMKNDVLQNVTKYLKNEVTDNRAYVTASVLYEGYQDNTEDTYEFLGQKSGTYYYVMEGLTSGSTEYDALIKMDSKVYKEGDGTGHNEQKTPVIESLDVLEDAFFVQPTNQDQLCAEAIAEEANITNVQTILDNMTRTITIDIEKNGNLYRVNVTYLYKYGIYTESVNHLIYTNAESQSYGLKSIYLFYLPHYASITSNVKDNIIINNNNNVKVNVHLIKQRITSANAVELLNNETLYKCNVTVKENVASFHYSSHDAYIDIRTNLGTNLYRPEKNENMQVAYMYQGSTGDPVSNPLIKNVLSVNTLDGSEEKDRIYEVTVSIYKKGEAAKKFAGTPVATITGSKDN